MKLLVSGSQTITDTQFVYNVLDRSPFTPDTIIQGDSEGVERNAMSWAVKNGIDIESHPIPDWVRDQVGTSAGPLRNSYMLGESDAVVAIWDGESDVTRDVIDKAEAAGLPMVKVVVDVDDDGNVDETVLFRGKEGDQMVLTEFE